VLPEVIKLPIAGDQGRVLLIGGGSERISIRDGVADLETHRGEHCLLGDWDDGERQLADLVQGFPGWE
jgi:hypothetical protein